MRHLGDALCGTLMRCHAPQAALTCQALSMASDSLATAGCTDIDRDAAAACTRKVESMPCGSDGTDIMMQAFSLYQKCKNACR